MASENEPAAVEQPEPQAAEPVQQPEQQQVAESPKLTAECRTEKYSEQTRPNRVVRNDLLIKGGENGE